MGKPIVAIPTGTAAGSNTPREYAALFCVDSCINEELLAAGLADFLEPVVGRAPDNIERLRAAARAAEAGKRGKWSEEEPLPVSALCCAHNADAAVSERLFERIHHTPIEGVVEFVIMPTRFTVFLPSIGAEVRVAIAGVAVPQPGDPALAEAKTYCTQAYMQTSIQVTPFRLDNGLFVCDVVCRLHSGVTVDVAVDLVSRGLVTVHPSVRRADSPLVRIEAEARRAGPKAAPPRAARPDEVTVTQMWSPTTFTIQYLHLMPLIEEAVTGPPKELGRVPALKECVLVHAGGRTFRGKVMEHLDSEMAIVKLIDYGDLVQVGFERLSLLPPELEAVEPQAVVVDLAFVASVDVADEVVDEIWGLVRDRKLFAFVVGQHERPSVLLTDRSEIDAESLNLTVFRLGAAQYFPQDATPMFQSLIGGFTRE